MLEEAPHILQVKAAVPPRTDEFGRLVPGSVYEEWQPVAECFCHDNSQQRQVSQGGQLWTYSHHVVYEGRKLALGSEIRCVDAAGGVAGCGRVIKAAECYSDELKGRCDLWTE